MKKLDKIIIGLLLAGSVIAVFYPDTKPFRYVIPAKKLLYEVNKQGRYISTDQVAQAIMENDPSYIYVDVRDPASYKKFTLNGAMNFPLDKIFDKTLTDILESDTYTVVLFSNGSTLADKAWLMLKSFDYDNIKVMKGGLNAWYRDIINPLPPDPKFTDKQAEKRYLFRKGAQVFFTGISPAGGTSAPKPKKAAVPVVKHKKKEVTGGCG